jgi:hypothetical protein
LKIGAAGDGDNRDHTFSAFQAVRRSIHWILPILPQTRKPERRSTSTLHQRTPQCLQATIYFAERDKSGMAGLYQLEQPGPALADLDFLIVYMRQHLAGVAHVEPIATPWAPHACRCAIKAILGA